MQTIHKSNVSKTFTLQIKKHVKKGTICYNLVLKIVTRLPQKLLIQEG